MDKVEEDRKKNFEQRLRYIEEYADWVKNTPNKVWSKQQKEMIDSVLRSADRIRIQGIVVSKKD